MHDRYVKALLSSIEARLSGRPPMDSLERVPDVDHLLREISRNMEGMMATLQEALDRVMAAGDRLDSLIEYNRGIRDQLDDVLKNVGLTAEQQAQIDAIFAEADENVAKTDSALNTNVPPAAEAPVAEEVPASSEEPPPQ